MYRTPPRDRPMFSPDLFLEDTQQVFSVRTGLFIGYHRPGEDLPTDHPEPQQPTETEDINQLKLEI